jgi:hypothetical protein
MNLTAERSGPSAMGLYNAHPTADMGHQQASQLDQIRLGQQMKNARPLESADVDNIAQLKAAGAPEWYNYSGMLPAKYDIPTAAKERLVARAAVREAAANVGSSRVPRPDPITDEEVDYVQAMKRQAELVDFDRYINTLVDPRKPGNLKWLMDVYPEYVHRRIAQVHDDYDFALRNQMIDSWGINTFDDLHFKFLVDQGKIQGPKLAKMKSPKEGYTLGWLAPKNSWVVGGATARSGLKLPFASANYGPRPDNPGQWQAGDKDQPLGGDRSYKTAAELAIGSSDENFASAFSQMSLQGTGQTGAGGITA